MFWDWQGGRGEPSLYNLVFCVQELLDEEGLSKFSWAALGLVGRDGRASILQSSILSSGAAE